jgi:acyl-CoA synthetase (AMP-forming)/AMP-acid ligase II
MKAPTSSDGQAATELATFGGLDAWATRTPDRVALSDGDTAHTFQELRALVEGVRADLIEAWHRANRPRFLPVAVDFSLESAIAVLACMRYQIPFAPIDSRLPPERLRHVVEQLGQPSMAWVSESASEYWDDAVVPRFDPAKLWSGPAASEVAGEGVVIFTSGSTGVPKGVVLTWEALEDRWNTRESITVETSDVRATNVVVPLNWILGLSRLARVFFGYSVLRIDPGALDMKGFFRRLRDFSVTHLTLPTQLARLVSQSTLPSTVRLPDVREFSFGGEGFRYEFLHQLAPMFQDSVVFSHSLGYSEAPLSFVHRFSPTEMPEAGAVHIGKIHRPKNLRLTPAEDHDEGVFDVLCSGYLATEYLGQPDLTQERFVVDAEGTRWWKSGDLVIEDGNGLYLHAGRIDDLVKVSGKLSSPSESERLLFSLAGVQAAVVLPEVSSFSTRLVAHLEVGQSSQLSRNDVLGYLREYLEPHLIPARIFFHETLPSTPRGKVDRAALRNFVTEQN